LLSTTKEQEAATTLQQSPLYQFIYALKSSEARRQYPKRLKMLFDYTITETKEFTSIEPSKIGICEQYLYLAL
jgi:hypothetical protein